MRTPSRRTFLKTSLGAAATAPMAGLAWRPVLRHSAHREVLRVASIGVGGMGWSDIRQVASHPAVKIVAICDVDKNNLDRAANLFEEARQFTDWRKLFRDMGDEFDAVTVSTPDHMHAPVAMTALMANKSVYCQKPLTHTISESRALRTVARRKPIVATQMGTQNASRASKRQALQMLKDGVVGEVREVHGWSDRPAGWWPQGKDRPGGDDAIPANLAWDLWIGVAPMRPYVNDTYAPFKWRGFCDVRTLHVYALPSALHPLASLSLLRLTQCVRALVAWLSVLYSMITLPWLEWRSPTASSSSVLR